MESTENVYMRRSGRTTRALIDALKLAAQGKRIIYVVPHSRFVNGAVDLVSRHAPDNLRPLLTFGRGRVGVKCHGGVTGSLEVWSTCPTRSRIAGLRAYIIHDHAWLDR